MNAHQLGLILLESVLRSVVVMMTVGWTSSVVPMVVATPASRDIHQLSNMCPSVGSDTVGICVEECSGDVDCPLDPICCSNGCGHTCQQRYTPGE